ncbi:glycosyltransferase [Lachnospiraceae bacterium 47-T17]
MRILVLWRQADVNIRKTIIDHVSCFQRYDVENEYFYFNIYNGRFAEDYGWIEESMFDAVIFHYSAIALRGFEGYWEDFLRLMITIWRNYPCKKILIPQDDYTDTERIWDLALGIKADIIYTIIRECDHPVLYPKSKLGNIVIKTVLTGYVEETYILDNTNDDAGALLGDNWLDFLASSRIVIGCLGGSGLADVTGEYGRKTRAYMALHPQAAYEEVKAACFPDAEENLTGMISPRIFDAAITKTCQVLVGEDYQGILRPDIDYIVLDSSFSNVDAVIEKMQDIEYCEKIANNCYEHVVASHSYTYKKFAKRIGHDINRREYVQEPLENLSKYIEKMCKKNNDVVLKEVMGKEERRRYAKV